MRFICALKLMKEGHKVKLPSWAGYWVYDHNGDKIWMHCKDGRVLEIRETEVLSYTLENICSDEWIVADETNTPELGGVATFNFGEAIKYLKRGFKGGRAGTVRTSMWNWLPAFPTSMQTITSSMSTTATSAIRPWPLWEPPVFRWAGWPPRQICWQMTGCLLNKNYCPVLRATCHHSTIGCAADL